MTLEHKAPIGSRGDEAADAVLRRATPEDRDQVFGWRNDRWLISFSAGRRFVSEKDHARWFSAILRNPNALLFIIVRGTEDVGTVRVEKVDSERAVLSVYLLRHAVYRGLGSHAIAQASRFAFEAWPSVKSIHAVIRADNAPSIMAFRKAGFCECSTEERLEQDTSTFVEMLLPLSEPSR